MNTDFETLRDEMEQTLTSLNDRQTQLRPGGRATRWSIQQTVEHLLLTYAVTEKVFDTRILKGTGTLARPSISQRIGQIVIIQGGFFPRGRTAPEMVSPAKENPAVCADVLIGQTGTALQSLDERLMAAGKIFGTRQRAISHIILGPLSVSQWSRFHLIHARHHMKFIAQVRREFRV